AKRDSKGTAAGGSRTPGVGPTIRPTAKPPWFGRVRGRAGYAMDRVLLSPTAGTVYGDSSWSGTESTVGNFSSSTTFWTWTAGAGAEMAFWGCWSAKLEYLFVGTPSTTPAAPTVTAVHGHPNHKIPRRRPHHPFGV